MDMTDQLQDGRGIQERILLVLLVVYAALAGVGMGSWSLVTVGCVLSVAARALGRAGFPPVAPMTPALVWIVGTMGLVLANIRAQFPMTLSSAAVTVVGSFVVLGFWAANRYGRDPAEAKPLGSSVTEAVFVGLLMALGLSLIAAAIFAIAAVAGAHDGALAFGNLPVLVLAYVAGGIVGGAIVGALRPLAVWPLGRMAMGIPVAAVVYGCVGAAMYVMGISDGPESWKGVLGMALGIGVIAGPMGGLTFHQGVSELDADVESRLRPEDGDDAA